MTSARSITASANPPRAAFTDFPLGHTCGPPNRPRLQRRIMRDALTLFNTIDRPGAIVDLDYRWETEWKNEARSAADYRTPRYDTPQYQDREDEVAAKQNHGASIACGVCVPSLTPRS